jgi:hypothetical protein
MAGLENPVYQDVEPLPIGGTFLSRFCKASPFRRAWKGPAIDMDHNHPPTFYTAAPDRRDILVPHLQGLSFSPGLERPGYLSCDRRGFPAPRF